MSRIYSIPFSATITPANTDVELVNISPADDKPVRLRGLILGQTSEVGDAQEEGIRIDVIRMTGTITDSSGGGTATPVPEDDVDTAAGMTVRTVDPTVSTQTGGATTVMDSCPWNLRGSPLERWWPEDRYCPQARQTQRLLVRWVTTVADNVDVVGTAYVEEI